MNARVLHAVVETQEFINKAKECMDAKTKEDFIIYKVKNGGDHFLDIALGISHY